MSSTKPLEPQINVLFAWIAKFEELNLRERMIVSVGLLGITWAIWFGLVEQHFADQGAALARTSLQLESQQRASEQTRAELQAIAKQDPNLATTRQLSALRQELSNINTNLDSTLSQFIPPQTMTLVLKDLMTDHKNLKFSLLNRLPARELLPAEEESNLYMHPLQLELEGEYLEVMDYVASLESGKWQFNWQSLEFTTKGYPNGVATIEIETLSKEKHWLGL